MIIEFSVGNYLSFKDPVTLSLIAARAIKSRNRALDADNLVAVQKDLSLLTSTAIYGPNAGGKSNLVKAAAFMCEFARSSFRETPAGASIRVQPFRLNTLTPEQPSTFEMVFLMDGVQYRYGFAVEPLKVKREWLYMVPKSKEIVLFEREGQTVKPNPSSPHAREFRAILTLLGRVNPDELLRPNALFLSTAAQNNGPTARKLVEWFSKVRFISGLSDETYGAYTLNMFDKPEQRAAIVDIVRRFDLSIQEIEMVPETREELLKRIPEPLRDIVDRIAPGQSVRFVTRHDVTNENGQVVGQATFELSEQESEGTQKLFFMAGPILDALNKGLILWIDEMEARLHPNLTEALVGLFNSRASNPHGAQLIFTTHDSNLLDLRKLRRDQIWFVDKDRFAASRLYSLAEFKVRNDDASLEDDYIRGVYGAIPNLRELDNLFEKDEA